MVGQRSTGETRKERQVRKIAWASTKLFSKKGYRETSMEDIARILKMSKGNLYHYFTDKNEILAYILSSFLDLILEGLDEIISAADGANEKLRRFIERHIDIYGRYMLHAKVLFKEVNNLSPKDLKRTKEKERRYYRIAKNLIAQSLAGSASDEEVTALTFFLLGMCNWTYSWYDPKGKITPHRLSELIYRVFIEGISGLKTG